MDLASLPIVDQHAHNLLRPEAAARRPYPAAFTEGYDPEVVERHARHTLFYRRSIREVAAQLNRSEGAIKQLQMRALQTLRARMEGCDA